MMIDADTTIGDLSEILARSGLGLRVRRVSGGYDASLQNSGPAIWFNGDSIVEAIDSALIAEFPEVEVPRPPRGAYLYSEADDPC